MDDLSDNDLTAHLKQLEQRLHEPQVRGSAFSTRMAFHQATPMKA